MQKILVTSALPYANGPIHLGHIAGAYLPADVYVRFHRLMGNDIVHICGTDEHGVPITLSAEREKVTPRTIVKRYHENIKRAFDRLNIIFDNFSGTSNVHNKYHAVLSREFFMKLHQKGYLTSHLTDQHYCLKCDRFLADRFIEGTCPRCGYREARGDECSQCNHQFDPMELKDARCKICSQTPTVRSTKHWYLLLNKLQEKIEAWIDTKPYWKENVLNFVRGWFKVGLKERPITRDLYWGVPVPLEEAAGKVLYVWFEAPIGYITSTMEWAANQGYPDKWKEYWQNPDCRIVHFIGKDNIPFHAVMWPATLLGVGENYQLPWQIPANEYLNFGLSSELPSEAIGSKETPKAEEAPKAKASKSIGNVVWVHECLDVFPADAVRYYLAACAPDKNDTLFTWKDFQQKFNSELLGSIGNLANRILKFIASRFEGRIPKPGTLTKRDQEVMDKIHFSVEHAADLYSNFEMRTAIAEVVSLARLGNQYFDEKAPWRTINENPTDCATCLYVGAQMVKTIAVLLHPVIPQSTGELWKQLGQGEDISRWQQASEEVPAGHSIGKPEGIFHKIEDETIAPIEQKLAEVLLKAGKVLAQPTNNDQSAEVKPVTKSDPEVTSVEKPKALDGVSMADFKKLDIRIGEIVEAQKVPKTKKLLQVSVKIGNEIRTLVAGIAQNYTPEQLKGKKVPVLVNLESAQIQGIKSEGMILCTELDGKPVILCPEKDVPPGAPIH